MVPCLHCGYLYFCLISSKHIYLENLSYIKKQQEQAVGNNKTISSKHSTVKACSSLLLIMRALRQRVVLQRPLGS